MPRSGRRGGYEAQRRSPAEGDPVKRCFSSVIGDIMGMVNEGGGCRNSRNSSEGLL